MDKAAEEVYIKLLELHEEQKRDKGEDKLTTEEAYTMVLGKRSGYIPGMGPGPKPLDRESTNGQRLRAQIRAEVEAEMTTPFLVRRLLARRSMMSPHDDDRRRRSAMAPRMTTTTSLSSPPSNDSSPLDDDDTASQDTIELANADLGHKSLHTSIDSMLSFCAEFSNFG
ncbi:hypothetical protein KSP39_PZI012611 [Platanthera zijinensis]|uniref:Uncharacterized protein n=1 Tax=Platanthera zijinensis TaxID=2320716 RepID=A0AAP0BF90_9ASPA